MTAHINIFPKLKLKTLSCLKIIVTLTFTRSRSTEQFKLIILHLHCKFGVDLFTCSKDIALLLLAVFNSLYFAPS